ncbi:MAG: hypothetical protein EZS28_030442 [Streblomastix strix]|uniref:Poly [ADP-ribose] polymerase n=1 Tax=Streblomastix strix TaxID=222440 RepID=A0A5J4UV43_9EUKA|nr:MAG: hypothetical protein EZS28_030442 [Streblomastix strix]
MDIEQYNQKTFVLNNENLQGLEFANSNGRGLHFASQIDVQVIVTELMAYINMQGQNVDIYWQQKQPNLYLAFDGNAGREWSSNNGGFYEATNRLVRAASVISRIKRLIVSTQNLTIIPSGSSITLDDARKRMKILCDRFNIMFRLPGLEPLEPNNANKQCTVCTLALARMAAAIDPDFTQIVAAARRSGYVQKWEDSEYQTAIVFNPMTTHTIMQCLNTTLEALNRDDPQYDLIAEYLKRSMKCSEGGYGDECGPANIQQFNKGQYRRIEGIYRVRQPDFDYRFQESEKCDNRLLLWHGTGKQFWLSVLAKGLLMPGSNAFTSFNQTFPTGGYGIFFSNMALMSIGYSQKYGQSDIQYMGLFDNLRIPIGNLISGYGQQRTTGGIYGQEFSVIKPELVRQMYVVRLRM